MIDPNNGPKDLGKLFARVKDHVAAGKVLIGKAVKKKQDFPPTKHCPICGIVHSPSCIAGDTSMKSKECEKCQGMLDQAFIALVSTDKRYAFVRGAAFAGLGPIINISKEVMDNVVARQGVLASQQQEPPPECPPTSNA